MEAKKLIKPTEQELSFLLCGDVHMRGNAPENRLDNFFETMKKKIREISYIANWRKCTAILQAGDLWDSPLISLAVAGEYIRQWHDVNIFGELNRLMEIINNPMFFMDEQKLNSDNFQVFMNIYREKVLLEAEIKKKVEGYVPMYTIGGNHDFFGNNIESIDRTMLGFLDNIGLYKLLDRKTPVIFTKNGLSVAVTAACYHNDIDRKGHEDDYVVEEKLAEQHIHLVHGMLSDKSMGDIIRHTTIDQIKHTKADLTYAGHDHIGFPLTEVEGKFFYNSGAVPRLSNGDKERSRMPKVCICTASKKGLRFEEVYLDSALPGDMVLDRSKQEDDAYKEEKFAELQQSIRSAGRIEGYGAIEIVKSIADKKELKPKVRDGALLRISKAMENMKCNVG